MSSLRISEILVRKAVRDAGFDVIRSEYAGWLEVAASGVRRTIWVRWQSDSVALALPSASLLAEARSAGGLGNDVAPPPSVAVEGVLNFPSADAVYCALNRVRVLMEQTPTRLSDVVRERLAKISVTERTAEVTQRVGQDVFREALQEYWEGRCAVTGLALSPLLRASHSKPWAESSSEERLDVHNGFLLAVHLDALFDKGLITFLGDGALLISGQVSAGDRDLLGLQPGMQRLRWVADGHRPYLSYHRDVLFKR